MASLRRRGRSFAAPIRLATGRIRNVAAAVGPAGHVLVAWEARGVVRARFKPPGSRRFRPTETIRSEPAFSTDLHAAVARSGHAFVAWSAQLRTEGGDTGPLRIQAAARRAGARFRPAQLLERLGDAVGRQPVDLGVDSRGRALVGWTGARLRLAESSGSAFTALPFAAEAPSPTSRPGRAAGASPSGRPARESKPPMTAATASAQPRRWRRTDKPSTRRSVSAASRS